jgi:exopolysaccharide biosynthesis polyprenyl glycosylphosphotransferase
MKNNASFVYGISLVVLDFLALLSAFVAAYIVRVRIDDRPLIQFVPARYYFATFVVLVVFWIAIFALLGLYNSSIYEKRFKEFGRLLIGSFIGLLFVLSVAYFNKETIFPARLVPVYGFVFAFILLIIFRNIARFVRSRLFRYGIGVNNILIVGNTEVVNELRELFKDLSSGYKIIGIAAHPGKIRGIRTFKSFEGATKHLDPKNVHSILQTELFTDPEKNNAILEYAQRNHMSYRFIPGNTELFVGNIDVELFRSQIPVIAVNQTALTGWGQIVKRIFDILMTLPIVILLLPIYILLSLIIFISDFGSPLFEQERVTRFNKVFKIYKFRSHKKKYNGLSPEQAFSKMGKPELIKQYRDGGDQIPNDPRVSFMGRLMRPLSLDELPQLFNILKGDISLVGPRALIPQEIELAKSKHHIVSVKSGLTGLAQVSGRKDISFEERRKLDLYYVQNWSFWLDITILLKTIRAVISGRGAV